jgi:hypothetical protein
MSVADWLWVLLVIGATARLTRLVTGDSITEPLRVRTRLWARRESRVGAWMDELITCPWCVSVWLGTLVAFTTIWWTDNRVLIAGMTALTASLVTGNLQAREPESEDPSEEESDDQLPPPSGEPSPGPSPGSTTVRPTA